MKLSLLPLQIPSSTFMKAIFRSQEKKLTLVLNLCLSSGS